MSKLSELAKNAGLFTSGHRACAGCGGAIVMNQMLEVAGPKTVVAMPTGCLEVVSTIYPFTAWAVPYIHVAFENAAAVISGVEAAYQQSRRKGKIKEKWNFIAIGGDGATYDIGLQALSGAIERGHDFLYVCYDNEAYMNTGIQRSSATPHGAHTTTSPAGSVIPGKRQFRKDLTEIIAAHGAPYVAQAIPSRWADFTRKVRKALDTPGPTFIDILAPCPLGWRFPSDQTIEISRLAVETKFWPLYEVIDGKYKLNYQPRKELQVREWMKLQGRFAHLFTPENEHVITELQEQVDKKWKELLAKCNDHGHS
jgi:pyruvate ferredoxin oxidoreductase beta subunit